MNRFFVSALMMMLAATVAAGTQVVRITQPQQGKRFDGIGAVNGGGATSVLLKDYPEPQRSQIMDMVFKPMFGASVSAVSDHYRKGMAGLLAPIQQKRVSTPYFDNLVIAPLDLQPNVKAAF